MASKLMVRIIGWFVPIMKELDVMLYQYDQDYVFDSDKFEKRFVLVLTPNDEGIREIVVKDYPTNGKFRITSIFQL